MLPRCLQLNKGADACKKGANVLQLPGMFPDCLYGWLGWPLISSLFVSCIWRNGFVRFALICRITSATS